ncbi:MAG TPA: AAA family ATPase [Candidatus Dormibacteraeota bacterium]|nr:AAA family ATPase [Candidatus Dormibacteraeota bacterium]
MPEPVLGGPPPGQPASRRAANTVTVLSARGGSGKTTLATNLAVALAERRGESAVLLDLNLEFGTTAIALDLRPRYTLRDIANAIESDVSDTELDALLLAHRSGLRLVPALGEPGDSELIPDGGLPRLINRLRHTYDHVIVDGRPSFRDFMLDLWETSDTLLVTCPPDVVSVLLTRAMLDAFSVVRVNHDKVLIVLNEVTPRARLTLSQVQKGLGTATFAVPYGGDALLTAADLGQVYIQQRPKDPAAVALWRLADQVAERGRLEVAAAD